ncbi:kinase-like protein [Scleroderma citrinum]
MAVKSSSICREFARKPHDIVKEARLIALASHPNVISFIKQEVTEDSQSLSLWMPYVPYSLYDLLSTSTFSPHPLVSFRCTNSSAVTPREQRFVVLAKSIIFQILCAVDHLHETAKVAHRDIKPSNILLSATGCIKLVDFGTAWKIDESESTREGDLWPEHDGTMFFEVSTGPYRAPELLFGPRSYDAFAIDCWSLGVTFSEFFTPLRLRSDEEEEMDAFPTNSDSESDTDELTKALEPFIVPKGLRAGDPTAKWLRDNLFNGQRGEIGLAWSIFKIRGSPKDTNWPSFMQLPDANKLSFANADAVDLTPLLPNLPPSTLHVSFDTKTHMPLGEMSPTPLDLIHRFLIYEPSIRLRPRDALHNPWFEAELGLLLPDDYPVASTQAAQLEGRKVLEKWESKTLGELLKSNLPNQKR